MVKWLLGLGLVLGSAHAFTLKPARVGSTDIKKYDSAEYAQSFNYREVAGRYPYLEIYPAKYLPDNQFFTNKCIESTKKQLKSPYSAKFSSIGKTTYSLQGGVYTVSGNVDSQNSYGAMIRNKFYCVAVFEGDKNGGTVWMYADFFTSN